jgi:hypothetical protein
MARAGRDQPAPQPDRAGQLTAHDRAARHLARHHLDRRSSVKSIVRLLAAATLAGSGVLVASGTASATPGNCSITHPSSRTVAAKCTSGTGEVRVIADCLTVKTGNDPIEFTMEGPWVTVGHTSQVTCGNRPPQGDYELR